MTRELRDQVVAFVRQRGRADVDDILCEFCDGCHACRKPRREDGPAREAILRLLADGRLEVVNAAGVQGCYRVRD